MRTFLTLIVWAAIGAALFAGGKHAWRLYQHRLPAEAGQLLERLGGSPDEASAPDPVETAAAMEASPSADTAAEATALERPESKPTAAAEPEVLPPSMEARHRDAVSRMASVTTDGATTSLPAARPAPESTETVQAREAAVAERQQALLKRLSE